MNNHRPLIDRLEAVLREIPGISCVDARLFGGECLVHIVVSQDDIGSLVIHSLCAMIGEGGDAELRSDGQATGRPLSSFTHTSYEDMTDEFGHPPAKNKGRMVVLRPAGAPQLEAQLANIVQR